MKYKKEKVMCRKTQSVGIISCELLFISILHCESQSNTDIWRPLYYKMGVCVVFYRVDFSNQKLIVKFQFIKKTRLVIRSVFLASRCSLNMDSEICWYAS